VNDAAFGGGTSNEMSGIGAKPFSYVSIHWP
jgi:hypothetical protein